MAIKRSKSDIRLESLKISEINVYKPTGILKCLLALDNERFSFYTNPNNLPVLDQKSSHKDHIYAINSLACYRRSLMLQLFLLRSFYGVEECADITQEAEYMLAILMNLKKSHFHYEFTNMKLTMNYRKDNNREVVFSLGSEDRTERNLIFTKEESSALKQYPITLLITCEINDSCISVIAIL
jgi:hypothetical protein